MSTETFDETPWEISVFAALLNMRWAHCIKASSHQPDLVNALDDRAETALGDVLLRDRDRLLLFELKASWIRASTETTKPIFERYAGLYYQALGEPNDNEFDDLMLLSNRCHFLVYWEDVEVIGSKSARGMISFSPYALFVLDRLLGKRSLVNDYRSKYAIAKLSQDSGTIVEAASIVDLFDGTISSASGNLHTGEDVELKPLGLNKADFLRFVTLLQGENSVRGISLKLIAFSPVSGFVRCIRSIEEAVQLGHEWAEETASSKPKGETCPTRAGKQRTIGNRPLTCDAPGSPSSEKPQATGENTPRPRVPRV